MHRKKRLPSFRKPFFSGEQKLGTDEGFLKIVTMTYYQGEAITA